MRFAIYPSNPLLRVVFLIGYFLLSIQTYYWLLPRAHHFSEAYKFRDAEKFALMLVGVAWVFILLTFVLEILQRKKRTEPDVWILEMKFLIGSIAMILIGLFGLAENMLSFTTMIELIAQSRTQIYLIAGGVSLLSGLLAIRHLYLRKKDDSYQDSSGNADKPHA